MKKTNIQPIGLQQNINAGQQPTEVYSEFEDYNNDNIFRLLLWQHVHPNDSVLFIGKDPYDWAGRLKERSPKLIETMALKGPDGEFLTTINKDSGLNRYENSTWDVIICLDALQSASVENTLFFLYEIVRVLRSNGRAVIGHDGYFTQSAFTYLHDELDRRKNKRLSLNQHSYTSSMVLKGFYEHIGLTIEQHMLQSFKIFLQCRKSCCSIIPWFQPLIYHLNNLDRIDPVEMKNIGNSLKATIKRLEELCDEVMEEAVRAETLEDLKMAATKLQIIFRGI